MSNTGSKLERVIVPAGNENAAVADDGCRERGAGEDVVAALQTSPGEATGAATGEPTIDHRIQMHLGRKLKQAYEELVREPVPDKFHRLLAELERREKKQ